MSTPSRHLPYTPFWIGSQVNYNMPSDWTLPDLRQFSALEEFADENLVSRSDITPDRACRAHR